MEEVYVIGAGQTPFGRLKESSRETAATACKLVLEQSGVDPATIQGLYVGNCFGLSEQQGHLGPLIATSLGIPKVPAMTIESACASGSVTFREAYMSVAGGFSDLVLAVGVEKVSHLDIFSATSYFAMGSDYAYEGRSGITFPGLYALMATAYLQKHERTQEDLAHIAVKNHQNASLNPKAHIQKPVTVEEVMASRMIAYPLKLYDCCPFSDGAAAAVLVSKARFRELGAEGIRVLGSGRSGMTAALHDRPDLTRMESARWAGEEAYRQAGLTPKDVDFAEVHDCFTIAEAIALEELQLAKPGEGAVLAREERTTLGGELPVNPSGGLKAKGHPVGATGLGQIVEVFEQLLGRSGPRQVDGAEIGLTHNVGATGGSAAVHLFTAEG